MHVHAHPDDESSKGAASTAMYVAQGVDVHVATCTGGERGSILNPNMDRPDILENITEIRRQEMERARDILGIRQDWLGWTIWDQSTPQVRSEIVGYKVVDEHLSTATVEVRLSDEDVVASCTLRAYAEDHTVVGELVFTPADGQSVQDVRTERLATSVELLGCTAPGQSRPR
jgi:hypothetical protein